MCLFRSWMREFENEKNNRLKKKLISSILKKKKCCMEINLSQKEKIGTILSNLKKKKKLWRQKQSARHLGSRGRLLLTCRSYKSVYNN